MSHSHRILVTRRIPQKALRLLETSFKQVDVHDSDDAISKKELLKHTKRGIDGLYCLLTDDVDKEVLDSAGTRLKVVSTMSVGLDHIDLHQCKIRGIKVGYTPDVLTSATAEFAVSLLLATSRRVVESTQAVKDGEWGTWKPMWMCGPSLNGSTVGIVGLGRIGKEIVKILKPFGVHAFLYNARSPKSKSETQELGVEFASLPHLLRESDFVICACALTSETKGLFSHREFKDMKDTSVFVNISRGGVVDQDALYEALTTRQIALAGSDVTTPEPLPKDHPLLSLSNCVVTPHIGSASIQTREDMAVLAAENLINGLKGTLMPAQYIQY